MNRYRGPVHAMEKEIGLKQCFEQREKYSPVEMAVQRLCTEQRPGRRSLLLAIVPIIRFRLKDGTYSCKINSVLLCYWVDRNLLEARYPRGRFGYVRAQRRVFQVNTTPTPKMIPFCIFLVNIVQQRRRFRPRLLRPFD
jgi:hypothetical protein